MLKIMLIKIFWLVFSCIPIIVLMILIDLMEKIPSGLIIGPLWLFFYLPFFMVYLVHFFIQTSQGKWNIFLNVQKVIIVICIVISMASIFHYRLSFLSIFNVITPALFPVFEILAIVDVIRQNIRKNV